MKRIHIFKTGTHTDSHGQTLTFSETDLAAAISAYSPDIHQAPIVIGHPKTNAPAFGWVNALTGENGNLYAIPEQVNSEFSEQVQAGAYKKVSASFYPPNSPNNPVKGVYYLRHLGFLGAEPPAIKGLSPVEFSEQDQAVTLTLDFAEIPSTNTPTSSHLDTSAFDKLMHGLKAFIFGENQTTSNIDVQQPTTVTPPHSPPSEKEQSAMSNQTPPATPNTPDERDAEIAQLKKQLADKEKAERESQIAQSEQANAEFAESLVNDGKLAPKDKALVSAMLNAIDRDSRNTPVEFGEGTDKKALSQVVKDKLKQQSDGFVHLFSESAAKGKQTTQNNFEQHIPTGTKVDGDSLAKHQEILAYAETHKTDYVTAAMAIGG
ncbi:hypothetical protein [Acinetobacter sp. c3-l95]|uniref:hypothetical protein n=1 Tax=Acinetobacter sp. c3-l95 TaxID=3342804 RepID=UPI0035B8E187